MELSTRLVVVGASGTLGHALVVAARASGIEVVGTARSRVRAEDALVAYDMLSAPLARAVPDLGGRDVVVLLSSYTDVAWIGANPDQAAALDVDATSRVLDEALAAQAHVVFLSTDLVFDGERGGYVETDEPRPSTTYGRHKVMVERRLVGVSHAAVVRTGWNVPWRRGDHCPVVNTYRALLAGDARMATDNVFNVTDVEDTARALVAIARARGEGVFHVASTPPIARAELAAVVAETSTSGERMRFERVPFSTIPYAEPRPRASWLESRRPLDVSFTPARETIAKKTRLLDAWAKAEAA